MAALEAGLDWKWESFGEWLARLDGNIGVNAGFLVGHSTLRRTVMGEDAVGHEATEEQVAAMEAALHRALAEGAMGLSTSRAPTHNDGEGQPVPSRSAAIGELERLAAAVSDHPGTTIEMIVPGCLNGFSDDEVELLTRISLLSGRPVNWNVLAVTAANPEGTAHQLAASSAASRAGRPCRGPDPAPHHVAAPLLRARRHPGRPSRLAGVLRHLDRRADRRPCPIRRSAGRWMNGPSPTRPGCCATWPAGPGW